MGVYPFVVEKGVDPALQEIHEISLLLFLSGIFEDVGIHFAGIFLLQNFLQLALIHIILSNYNEQT